MTCEPKTEKKEESEETKKGEKRGGRGEGGREGQTAFRPEIDKKPVACAQLKHPSGRAGGAPFARQLPVTVARLTRPRVHPPPGRIQRT